MRKWIRKGDHVVVITGNDKGKSGEVLSKKDDRIVVQGVNIRKKHLRRTQETQGGRIVEAEKPIHISNVTLCSKADARPIWPKVKTDEKGDRLLVVQNGSQEIVYRQVKKPA